MLCSWIALATPEKILAEPSAFKIIVGWVSAGILLPTAFIYYATPLAGLTLLVLIAGILMVIPAPIAHLLIARAQHRSGNYSPLRSTGWIIAGLLAVLTLLMVSGGFNFV
jgi:hypothetical protein